MFVLRIFVCFQRHSVLVCRALNSLFQYSTLPVYPLICIPLHLSATLPGYHLVCILPYLSTLLYTTLSLSCIPYLYTLSAHITCIAPCLYITLQVYHTQLAPATQSICHLHDTSPVSVFADGSGRDMCNRCHGRGVVQCPHCKGHGQVKNFIELTVSL